MEMPNATVLLGNHEKMMLDALRESNDSREELRLWYENGGKITHIDYYALEADEQAAIVEYIRQMPLAAEVTVNGRAYLLVQGAPPELYGPIPSDAENEREFTVWTRLRPEDKMPDGKTVIFGHTPTAYYQEDIPLRIWHGGDKIGIDCGAGQKPCRPADSPACGSTIWPSFTQSNGIRSHPGSFKALPGTLVGHRSHPFMNMLTWESSSTLQTKRVILRKRKLACRVRHLL